MILFAKTHSAAESELYQSEGANVRPIGASEARKARLWQRYSGQLNPRARAGTIAAGFC